ncbi:MAG: DUF4388 domain-containing protein [Polyangiaceae bacterium]|nr:DUF4388 domain-containing protein [Polyangiaceae bacterium]MCB9606568.1 DUF4388 domain-containing protein [Polyangiaceae bacterium]
MSRSVLLVDSDLDALGELASVLRARGLSVAVADEPERALERAERNRPDAILIAEEVALSSDFQARLAADRSLRDIPRFILVPRPISETPSAVGASSQVIPHGIGPSSSPPSDPISNPPVSSPLSSRQPTSSQHHSSEPPGQDAQRPRVELNRADVDQIAQRVMAVPKAAVRGVRAESGDFRGDLHQVGVVDLLQLLGMNRRTGALSVTTSSGVGEVRLEDGEVVDAVYRRLEGEKALYRLLGEREGTFSFAGGYASALRRVETPTHSLLMEGMRRVDEVAALKTRLPVSDALLLVCPVSSDAPQVDRLVGDLLIAPRTVDELTDELPQGDLEILTAIEGMLASGIVRLIPKGAVRAVLTEPEQMSVLSAMVARLVRPGFGGNPRLIFAGPPERLGGLGHATRRIADAIPPTESTPTAPVPHVIASIRLGESVDLDIVALPELEAYAPLWPLCLAGAAAVVRLDDRESPFLEAACSVAEVPLLEAVALLGEIDEADPIQAAALIRMSVEQVAGHAP